MGINIQEITELLHLCPVSTEIYIELLTHGPLSKEQLCKFIDNPKEKIQKGILELLEKGFILNIKNTKEIEVFQPLSVLQLEERLEREKELIKNLKKYVLPQFQQPQKLEIMKYEGWEGVKHVYTEVLEEAIKTKKDIYAFENNISNSDIGEIFLETYIKRRIKNKVRAYVICPIRAEDKDYKEKYQGKYTKIKLLKSLCIDANVNIVGDLVMTFSTDPPRGTLRRNQAEANTWRSVFQSLWTNN